jgi:hypothetical protein
LIIGSSYVIFFGLFFLSFPLFYLPIPWHLPKDTTLSLRNFRSGLNVTAGDASAKGFFGVNASAPDWFRDGMEPLAYVQQVVIRSAVSTWNDDLILTDAFRGPLWLAFDVVRTIGDHKVEDGFVWIEMICN